MTGPDESPGTPGPGCVAALGWVGVGILAPPVLLGAAVTNAVLRRRWPDRAVAWALVLVGGLGAAALLLWSDYPGAWRRVVLGSWSSLAAAPSWRDWLLLLLLGLAYGPMLGAAWWRLRQPGREAHPYRGPELVAHRLRVEERRRRVVTHTAQRLRHTSGSWAVRAAARPWAVPPGDELGPFLGVYQRGDLGGERRRTVHRHREDRAWRSGPYVRLPLASGKVRHAVVLGASGLGKTETTLGLCEWAIRQGWQVCYLSAKEPPTREDAAAPRLEALAMSLGKTTRTLNENSAPFDPMRGTPAQVRDKFVRIEEWGDRYWQHCANLLLALVLELSTSNGQDVRALPELVYALTRTKLQQLAGNDPRVRELVDALEDRSLAGAMTRYASLAVHLSGWIGSAGSGWAWEDADVCVAELPTGRQPEAGAALLRLLLRDFATYLFDPERRQLLPDGSRRPVLFVVEEAGQVANDPVIGAEFVSLVERGRTAGAVAVVTAQDPGGLGDERVRAALMTNGVTVTYRQNVGAEDLAKLAGVRWHDEASATYDVGGLGVAGSTRRQETFKFSPQYLRELGPGEAVLVAQGRYAGLVAAMGAAGYVQPVQMRQLAAGDRKSSRPASTNVGSVGDPDERFCGGPLELEDGKEDDLGASWTTGDLTDD